MTGCSFRRRNGLSTENLTVSDIIDYLSLAGYRVQSFWDEVDALLSSVFQAFILGGLADQGQLNGRFYLAGVDIMMRFNQDRFSLCFLETNYVPCLVGWGIRVDDEMALAYQMGFKALFASEYSSESQRADPYLPLTSPSAGGEH